MGQRADVLPGGTPDVGSGITCVSENQSTYKLPYCLCESEADCIILAGLCNTFNLHFGVYDGVGVCVMDKENHVSKVQTYSR